MEIEQKKQEPAFPMKSSDNHSTKRLIFVFKVGPFLRMILASVHLTGRHFSTISEVTAKIKGSCGLMEVHKS